MKTLWIITAGLAVLVICAGIMKGVKDAENSTDRVAVVDSVPVGVQVHPGAGTDDNGTDKREEEVDEKDDFVYRTHVVSLADLVPPETEKEDLSSYSAQELADHVLNEGLNGSDREQYLGDRYDEVQALIDQKYTYVVDETTYVYSEAYYEPSGDALNPYDGINYYYGTLETYYNLPMDGVVDWMHDLGYQGDYWVRSDGVKMFGDYVMVAAEYDQYPKGSVVETSLGLGLVCDTGEGGYDWFDIATAW